MVFVRDALECLITENLSRGSIELPVCRLFINIAAVGPLLKVGETKKKKRPDIGNPEQKAHNGCRRPA